MNFDNLYYLPSKNIIKIEYVLIISIFNHDGSSDSSLIYLYIDSIIFCSLDRHANSFIAVVDTISS
jgi:hypothetical protein